MADIPVYESTAETVVVVTSNGQATFNFDFLVLFPEQMTVFHGRGDVETALDYPAGFSVSGLDDPNGGTVTLNVATLANDVITMRRVTPIERLNDWQNEGDYKAALVNREQDTVFMIMQELARGIDEGDAETDKLRGEAVLLPDGYTGAQKLPPPSPGRVIGYGSDGGFQALPNSAAEAELIAEEVRELRQETFEDKEAAEQARIDASGFAGAAAGSASSASTDADRAELAAGNAFINANVYADVATGRAAVADGQQFQVLEGVEYARYRRDSSSTQTEVGRYPSAAKVDVIDDKVARLDANDGAERYKSDAFTRPYVYSVTGTESSATTYRATELIPVVAGDRIKVTSRVGNAVYPLLLVYDEAEAVIAYERPSAANQVQTVTYTASVDGFVRAQWGTLPVGQEAEVAINDGNSIYLTPESIGDDPTLNALLDTKAETSDLAATDILLDTVAASGGVVVTLGDGVPEGGYPIVEASAADIVLTRIYARILRGSPGRAVISLIVDGVIRGGPILIEGGSAITETIGVSIPEGSAAHIDIAYVDGLQSIWIEASGATQ